MGKGMSMGVSPLFLALSIGHWEGCVFIGGSNGVRLVLQNGSGMEWNERRKGRKGREGREMKTKQAEAGKEKGGFADSSTKKQRVDGNNQTTTECNDKTKGRLGKARRGKKEVVSRARRATRRRRME